VQLSARWDEDRIIPDIQIGKHIATTWMNYRIQHSFFGAHTLGKEISGRKDERSEFLYNKY